MVKPRRGKIAPNPSKKDIPPEADEWAASGGIDPELQKLPPIHTDPPTPTPTKPEPEPEPKGKPYPHRVSFDMTTEQYKRLKRASFEEERSLNEIIREAVEDWLKTRNY